MIILVSRYVWKDVSALIHIYRGESFSWLKLERDDDPHTTEPSDKELKGFSDTHHKYGLMLQFVHLWAQCPL